MISEFDYFFYEWLILFNNLDDEKFKQLTDEEFLRLKNEFINFCNKLM